MKKCKTCAGPLDPTNERIIRHLQKNARTSYASIAQDLSLSVNTVRDRILGMERKGIIRGYQPTINHSLCGRPVHALVALRSNGRKAPLEPVALQHPFVQSAYTSAGPVNLLLEVHAPSMDDINEFISEHVYPLGFHSAQLSMVQEMEVRSTSTHSVTSASRVQAPQMVMGAVS